jgi:hypothetical protein
MAVASTPLHPTGGAQQVNRQKVIGKVGKFNICFRKEHKSGFGLEKLPTRKFHANWASLLSGQLAFKLVACFKRLV